MRSVFAIALTLALFVTIAFAAVTVEFQGDLMTKYPIKIHIKGDATDKVHGMMFTSKFAAGEAGTDFKEIELTPMEWIGYGSDVSGGCLDSTTRQVVGYIESSAAHTFSYKAIGAATLKEINPDGTAVDVICGVQFIKPDNFKKFTSNFEIKPQDGESSSITATGVPTAFGEATVPITSVTTNQKDKNVNALTATLSFKPTAGIYDVHFTTGYTISSAVADLLNLEWRCGSNKKTRIIYGANAVKIYVLETPKDQIECQIGAQDSHYKAKDVTVELVVTSLWNKDVTQSKSVTWTETPTQSVTTFSVRPSQLNDEAAILNVYFSLDPFFAKPIAADSKVVITTTNIPLDKLITDVKKADHTFCTNGEFAVEGSNFVVTKFTAVDGKFPTSLSCYIIFSSYEYTTFKSATVSVKANDITIQSFDRQTKLTSSWAVSLYTQPKVKYEDKDPVATLDGNIIHLTDKFSVKNNDYWFVPSSGVKLQLTIKGVESLPLSYDDIGNHLACKVGKDEEVKLNWHKDQAVWIADLPTSESSKFDFEYTCTRSYPLVSKFGLYTTTSFGQLKFAAITVSQLAWHDSDKYTSDSSSAVYQLKQPETAPADVVLPSTIKFTTSVSKHVALALDLMSVAEFNIRMNDFKAEDLITAAAEDLYTVTAGTKSWTQQGGSAEANYVDIDATTTYKNFVDKGLKVGGDAYGMVAGYYSGTGSLLPK